MKAGALTFRNASWRLTAASGGASLKLRAETKKWAGTKNRRRADEQELEASAKRQRAEGGRGLGWRRAAAKTTKPETKQATAQRTMKQDFAKAQGRDEKAGGHEKPQAGGEQELEASAKRLRTEGGRGLGWRRGAAKAAKPETKRRGGVAGEGLRRFFFGAGGAVLVILAKYKAEL